MFEQGKAAYRSHPPEAARSKAFDSENYPQAAHRGQQLRLPPYARQLKPRPDRTLLVVVGKSGWELFSRGGITTAILLPDPNPAAYRWPSLAGWHDALVVDSDGDLTAGEERELARALLTAGCPYVIGTFSSYKGGRTV